jgi:hypothetical protein
MDEVPEGRSLDYKAELPGGKDAEKKELASDASSFANGAGGYIIYGISEKKDGAGKNTGLPEPEAGLSNGNVDPEILRLESILRSTIDPVIPGVRIKQFAGFAKGPVVLLYIPRSWAGPHMVTAGGDSRFHSRGSAGKHSLDVHEIRSAFSLSAELPTLIRRFRDERLGRIVADETPVALDGADRLVLHLVPFSAMGMEPSVDLATWAKTPPPPLSPNASNHRYNFDGFVTFNNDANRVNRTYFQLFRSGAIEAVRTMSSARTDGTKMLRPWWLEEIILDGLRDYVSRYEKNGVELPVVVMASLLSVKGAMLPPSATRGNRGSGPAIERDTLLLPDVLLRDYADDLPKLMRPAFDALWQAVGTPRSYCYDENGAWNRDFRW